MCGTEPKVGLISSSLPSEIIEKLQTEDDLLAALNTPTETPEQQASDNYYPDTLGTPSGPDMPQSNILSPHPDDQNGEESVPQDTADQQSSLSPLSSRQHNIVEQRKGARDSQVSQAERMVKRSRVDLKTGEVGDNVAIPIPTVDRGRGVPVTSWVSSSTATKMTYTE